MRLSIVSDTFYPDINGVAKTLERLSHELHRKGHEIEVLHPSIAPQKQSERHYPFTVVETSGLPLLLYPDLNLGLPQFKKFKQRWTRIRPGVIYVATQGLLGLSAIAVARQLGIPIVSGYHTNFPDYIGHYGFKLLKTVSKQYLRYFHNLTQCTLVPTTTVAQELNQDGIRNIMRLGRGIDLDRFHPTRRSTALRQSLNIQPDDIVVLMVGRIAQEKNLTFGIQTTLDLSSKFPNLKCMVVGDGPLRKKLEAQFPQVIWTGTLKGEALATHYASADLFLFPSLTETYGNVLLEALASGLVTVSFDYAAAQEVIQHGQNGFVAAFGDPTQFSDIVSRLLEQQHLWDSLQKEARATASQYSWEKISEGFESTLQHVRLSSGSIPCQAVPIFRET